MIEAEAGPQLNDLIAVVFLIVDQLCRLLPDDDEEMTRREGFRASTFLDYFGLLGHLDLDYMETIGQLKQRVGALLAQKLRKIGGLVVQSDHTYYGIAPRFATIGRFGGSKSDPEVR